MAQSFTRREFLRRSSAAALATPLLPGTLEAGTTRLFAATNEYRRGGMLYRRLGQSDLFLSALGFGAHTDPQHKIPKQSYALSENGQSQRDRLIARALDRGVTTFDVYDGQYEQMARSIMGRRDRLQISVKGFDLTGASIDRRARLFGGYLDMIRTRPDGYAMGRPNQTVDHFLERWDVVRRAKQAGKVRTIGIASHSADVMLTLLDKLEGLDFIFFPYNFIHARADYGKFLPAAIKKGIGLVAIKPLAAGSIVRLDPQAQPLSTPEKEQVSLTNLSQHVIAPQVVAKLAKSLDRMPDETLCQAAMRFVYSRPFIASAIPAMFQQHELDENYAALDQHVRLTQTEQETLDVAREIAVATQGNWLPPRYRWLDAHWQSI